MGLNAQWLFCRQYLEQEGQSVTKDLTAGLAKLVGVLGKPTIQGLSTVGTVGSIDVTVVGQQGGCLGMGTQPVLGPRTPIGLHTQQTWDLGDGPPVVVLNLSSDDVHETIPSCWCQVCHANSLTHRGRDVFIVCTGPSDPCHECRAHHQCCIIHRCRVVLYLALIADHASSSVRSALR